MLQELKIDGRYGYVTLLTNEQMAVNRKKQREEQLKLNQTNQKKDSLLYLRNLDFYLRNFKHNSKTVSNIKKPSFRLKKGEESPTKLSKYDKFFVQVTGNYKNY